MQDAASGDCTPRMRSDIQWRKGLAFDRMHVTGEELRRRGAASSLPAFSSGQSGGIRAMLDSPTAAPAAARPTTPGDSGASTASVRHLWCSSDSHTPTWS